MRVAGAELTGEGAPLAVRNPATEATLAEVPSASPEQVDRATRGSSAPRAWRRSGSPSTCTWTGVPIARSGGTRTVGLATSEATDARADRVIQPA